MNNVFGRPTEPDKDSGTLKFLGKFANLDECKNEVNATMGSKGPFHSWTCVHQLVMSILELYCCHTWSFFFVRWRALQFLLCGHICQCLGAAATTSRGSGASVPRHSGGTRRFHGSITHTHTHVHTHTHTHNCSYHQENFGGEWAETCWGDTSFTWLNHPQDNIDSGTAPGFPVHPGDPGGAAFMFDAGGFQGGEGVTDGEAWCVLHFHFLFLFLSCSLINAR